MNSKIPPLSIILLAGGKGSRMGADTPKQYLPLDGSPIVSYSFDLALSIPEITEIVVVCETEFQTFFKNHSPKPLKFALPGNERQDSVASGFAKISPSSDYVLVHDTARPLIQKEDIYNLLNEGIPIGAATLGVPMKFTVKEIDENGLVLQTLDRSRLYNIQTPQLLKRDLLDKGLQEAKKQGVLLTDDVALAELIGHPVKTVIGSDTNLKITTPEDLEIAKKFLDATV